MPTRYVMQNRISEWSYASAKIGRHHFCTMCSDVSKSDLHGQKGELEVTP